MSEMMIWQFTGHLDWVRGPEDALDPLARLRQEEFRASLVFADTNRGEMFSTLASAAAKFAPYPVDDWSQVRGTVLLPSNLTPYATIGRQFLVVRGSHCEAVGRFTQIERVSELKE